MYSVREISMKNLVLHFSWHQNIFIDNENIFITLSVREFTFIDLSWIIHIAIRDRENTMTQLFMVVSRDTAQFHGTFIENPWIKYPVVYV